MRNRLWSAEASNLSCGHCPRTRSGKSLVVPNSFTWMLCALWSIPRPQPDFFLLSIKTSRYGRHSDHTHERAWPLIAGRAELDRPWYNNPGPNLESVPGARPRSRSWRASRLLSTY